MVKLVVLLPNVALNELYSYEGNIYVVVFMKGFLPLFLFAVLSFTFYFKVFDLLGIGLYDRIDEGNRIDKKETIKLE